MSAAAAPHIAVLPSPGMGHLIPLAEFAKALHRRHGVTTTFLIPNDGPLSAAQSSFLSALPPAVDYLLLPPVSLSDIPPGAKIETLISLTVARSLESLTSALKSLHESKKLAALVVDLFATDAFEAARGLGIPSYVFFCSTAMALSLFLHLPELDKTVSSEYRDVPDKLKIPGCIPIHGSDLLDPVQDRKNDAYKWVLHHASRYKLADGILVNSFNEVEPGPVEALVKPESGKPLVYPIGPLVKMGSEPKEPGPCSKWLDDQPIGSVLYVSFGSGGSLSHDQIIELALGLEMSGQRFLWVLRCPNGQTSSATYFNVRNTGDPLAYLPEGFLDRTRDRGLVLPLWAPQAQILAHQSTGAFLTHCGWNSILESVMNGVPMIAWPLYAEQRMNAVMLREDIRVALQPRAEEDGIVGRGEIAKVVMSLMEGEEGKGIRNRIRVLKDAAAERLSENGTSTKLLDEFVTSISK